MDLIEDIIKKSRSILILSPESKIALELVLFLTQDL